MEEQWVDYKGMKVSNLGNIIGKRGLPIKPSVKYDGYLIAYGKGVHRIVWEAFNGPIPKDREINHIDEDKTNNSLSNLSLVSHKENMNWGTVQKRISQKLSRPIVMFKNGDDYFKIEFSSYTIVNDILGWGGHHIADAASGKRKSAYGYFWKYK